MIPKISSQNIFKNIYNSSKNQKRFSLKANSLEKSPKCDNVSFGSTIDISKETSKISEILNEKILLFESLEDKTFKGTLKGYIENSILGWRDKKNYELYHCTIDKKTAKEIIENGLDWTKTCRKHLGPGVYFSPNAQDARLYGNGGTIIAGEYIGDKTQYPIFSPRFYDAVTNNEELNWLAEQNCGKQGMAIIDKYCHDFIQKELRIDYLYGGTIHGGGAYAVYNNDCMKLSPYGYTL